MAFAKPWLIVLGLLFLLVVTYHRVHVWESNLALWTDTLAKAPCLARPHAQLAMTYQALNEPDLWLREWQQVAALTVGEPCRKPSS